MFQFQKLHFESIELIACSQFENCWDLDTRDKSSSFNGEIQRNGCNKKFLKWFDLHTIIQSEKSQVSLPTSAL